MELYGYGEDSLTLWALLNKSQEILKKCEDDSKISDCSIFYRPSFGRKGGDDRAEFGEFDFIIATAQNIFLGESKCSNNINSNGLIRLHDCQINRHEIFSNYYQIWKTCASEDFFDKCKKEFPKTMKKKKIPNPNSKLFSNLIFVFQKFDALTQNQINVRNILLLFHLDNKLKNKQIKPPEEFTLIQIDAPLIEESKSSFFQKLKFKI